MQDLSQLKHSICAIYIHLVLILDLVYIRVESTQTKPALTHLLMLLITNYRSIFRESFLCPYIPHLKRAGFTDISDKTPTSLSGRLELSYINIISY